MSHSLMDLTGVEIAIVGMSGRFPDADDIDALWRNIRDGVESVSELSQQAMLERGIQASVLDDEDYVTKGIELSDVDLFDAEFFGYTPREAENIDPQQRLFLEAAWQTLEHAGYGDGAKPALTGIYAGSGSNLYMLRHLLPAMDLQGSDIASVLGLLNGNDQDSLASRVAYKLDLRGPAVAVQTACSTSLAAIHLACRGLLNYEADLALAGGVWLNLLQGRGYRYQPGAILSPDGHCRAFDALAGGTAIGSGVGVVALKRLSDALADGDTVHAVIKGSAMNNDGASKVGYTAPSVDGQASVIMAAQAMAGVKPDSIDYIEAHGTGTTLGDPIEIAALNEAFGVEAEPKSSCAIGTVKTNVGHLDAAAGVTGLIKTVMALKYQTLPPSLNFDKPNPEINFFNSPFYVNTETKPWLASDTPRRAGVSSFGMGGTNVHLVLEEAPPIPDSASNHKDALVGNKNALRLSARSSTALQTMTDNLAQHIKLHPDQNLKDIAHTLNVGRKRFKHRAIVLAGDRDSAIRAMEQRDPATYLSGEVLSENPSVAFLFPGQGSQHANMGKVLYERESTFRDAVDSCCEQLVSHLGFDLREQLFPELAKEGEAAKQLAQTAMTQPALFVIEYALAKWWIDQGVNPDIMLGHSIGEYVAACVAGVFSLEDALMIVAERGRLLQATASGAMMAVSLSEPALQDQLPNGCNIAAVNGAERCVIAGNPGAIEQAEQELANLGIATQHLHVSHAFHSELVDPMLNEFKELLSGIDLSPPNIPFVSNVSGKLISHEEACSPNYWVDHVRNTVRFNDGLNELLAKHDRILLEVGPSDTLSSLARRHLDIGPRPVLSSQCHPQRALQNENQLDHSLAKLWIAGVDIDKTQQAKDGRRVPLPTYPFERHSYWIEPQANVATNEQGSTSPRPINDWFYRPGWKRAESIRLNNDAINELDGVVLVLANSDGPDDHFLKYWRRFEKPLVQVKMGDSFVRLEQGQYIVRPGNREDFSKLLHQVQDEMGSISHIHHLWSLDAEHVLLTPDEILERGFYSLLALAQALELGADDRPRKISVIANQLEDVTGYESLCADKATLHGPCNVIPQEYPHLSCRLIDVQFPENQTIQDRLIQQVTAEIFCDETEQGNEGLVAYRGAYRWVRSYEPIVIPTKFKSPNLRAEGVYLITGGLGGIGLALAEYLAKQWQAKLVLVGRGFSSVQEELVAELEKSGTEVLVIQADVVDSMQVFEFIDKAQRHFGALHGVIHAAGISGASMISQCQRSEVEKVFAPKLVGTRNLFKALDGKGVDFIALYSSLSSFAGGVGNVDYASANAYLDAVAVEALRTNETRVLSINWDGWRDVGMAADMALPEHIGVGKDDGVLAFERIINSQVLPQIIVSTTPLPDRLSMDDGNILDLVESHSVHTSSTKHPRPNLSSSYKAPSEGLESGLVQIWGDFLGIEDVGVEDNLFELGGDSLLAIQLLAKVRSVYGVELHPATFFKQPTVQVLALLVEDHLISDIENGEAMLDQTSEVA